jgi:hypothetical protein
MDQQQEGRLQTIIALVQERERGMWKIGDALLDGNGSYAELKAVVDEINRLEGYTVKLLAKLRAACLKFPASSRNYSVGWEAHHAADSPEMLDAILKAAGNKRITAKYVRDMRHGIEGHLARRRRDR